MVLNVWSNRAEVGHHIGTEEFRSCRVFSTQTLKVALTMPTTTGDTVVIVRQLTGAPLSLTLSPSSTVAQLKKMVERKNSVAADSQRVRACPLARTCSDLTAPAAPRR